ncbi:MAG: methylenetetrahydrofolate reductase [NAD(P)H] [Pseudomonadota bacterium]
MSTLEVVTPQVAVPAPCAEDLAVSFEIFPPKSDAADTKLWAELARLARLEPAFVSVTYGAGGTTQERTLSTVERLRRETSIPPAAHLTCVGAARGEIDDLARGYWEAGVRHIVALRGDPQEAGGYTPHPEGYAYAADLVAGLRRVAPFEISVAAYPEVHPEAGTARHDLDNLKRKIDAGADRAITQFFFEPEPFLRFRDRAAAAGITAPILPGILPIVDFDRARGFAERCGASIPAWLPPLFEGLSDDDDTRTLVATVAACELCRQLREEGVEAFHFYTLNRAELTTAICRSLRYPVPITRTPVGGRR